MRTAEADAARLAAAIEDLHAIADMQEVERLQIAIWGSDPTWVVPSHLLYLIAESGGILLGARIHNDLVGFVLGLLGRKGDRLFHSSHMLGISEAYRGQGLGASLKLAQRERALSQGLDLMTWTFDPLEARNAHFNFNKLGVTSRSYRPNYYGPMRDAVNRGLPSDRLLVEWDLRKSPARCPNLESLALLEDGAHGPRVRLERLEEKRPVSIAVPHDIRSLRATDPEAALGWRLAVRQAFTSAFERGYVACGFREGGHLLYPSREET